MQLLQGVKALRTMSKRSVIVVTIASASQLMVGCHSAKSNEQAGLGSNGVQGPVVTVPVVIDETRADGKVHRESLGTQTYSEQGLALVKALRPVAVSFLESGELYSFTIDGADPVVMAAGGQIVAKSVLVDGNGRVVSWEPLDEQPQQEQPQTEE